MKLQSHTTTSYITLNESNRRCVGPAASNYVHRIFSEFTVNGEQRSSRPPRGRAHALRPPRLYSAGSAVTGADMRGGGKRWTLRKTLTPKTRGAQIQS